MALIGTIRKNSWLLIALMALALGGFILMDIVSNTSRNSMGDVNTLGKVNGQTIARDQFDKYEDLIYNGAQGDAYQRRNTIWNYFVENALVSQEAAKVGLGVGKEELMDLQFGTNPSPIIQQRFAGDNGQINFQALQNVKGMIEGNSFPDPRTRTYWAEQEKEIIKDRLQSKLIGLVSKSVYTPTWQAEMAYAENNERMSFLYARVPFDKIADTDIKVTDADYASYIKEHSKQYYQTEESRMVDYVTVDVIPSKQDSSEAKEKVSNLLKDWRNAIKDSTFVLNQNGSMDAGYKKRAELPASVADLLATTAIGSYVEPYLNGDSWSISKILDRKVIPDSVRARHILIKTGDANKTVDSLKNLVDTGKARFDSLAAKFGTDATNVKGGDLGWFGPGQMVPEFNDLCFNKAEQGKTYKVVTQFGVHLVEVTGKKFIKNENGTKYATISQRIAPGKVTEQTAKDKAIILTTQAKNGADLAAKAKEMGLMVTTSTPVKANDFSFGALGQGNTAREMIRWAFEEGTKKDQVHKEYFIFSDPNGGYFDSKYVVAALKTINPKGEATVDGVRSQIEGLVKNKLKAAAIMAKLGNTTDINSMVSQYGSTIDTASNIAFMQPSLPRAGAEPAVVGAAFGMANGAVSTPIEGNSGVYIVKTIMDKPKAPLPPDLAMFRRQVSSGVLGNVRSRLIPAMKKSSETEDNRSRFF
jgi:peptidyl-prolyl cis-trans isomerase D